MLNNVLSLRELKVADVMVPRADVIAVAAETTLGDLLALFRTAGHSRLPVYGETLDDPRGMVHIRDFLDFIAAKAEASQKGRRRSKVTGEGPNLGGVDLTSSTGKLTMGVINAVAEFERDLLIERTQAGLRRARAEGKAIGRPASLTTDERAEVERRLESGETVSALSKAFSTSRQTIMRVRDDRRAQAELA